MALTHFFCAASILLLSLLVIASAADYGYEPKPDTVKPETSYVPAPKPKPTYDTPNSGHDQPKASYPGYGYGPKSDLPKPKPDFKYNPKPNVDLPKVTVPKIPNHGYHYIPMPHHLPKPKLSHGKPGYEPESLLPICVEGLILCKSGSNYIPVEGSNFYPLNSMPWLIYICDIY